MRKIMTKEIYAERLSDLVLNLGVSLKKGDYLNIVVSPDAYYYAQRMAMTAYSMGAKYVNIRVTDLLLDKTRAYYQNKEDIKFIPSFIKECFKESEEVGMKNVRIECRDERIDIPTLNPENYQVLAQNFKQSQKSLSSKYMSNQLMWCVCCAPGPKWAKAVLGEDKTEEDLADILSSILHIDTPDYIEYWKNEDAKTKSWNQDFALCL